MNPLFERTALVFSESSMDSFINAHILVAGVGGVGGFVAESLARSGIGELTLIDHDTVSSSNKNRQIIALDSTKGFLKTEVMKQRILDINPECKVNLISEFVKADDMESLLTSQPFTYVVDAIDSLNCKVALVATAKQLGLPIVSSMGAGRRIDPSKIELADISKTYGCGLARQMRQRLKKQRISKGIMTVFSSEVPKEAGPMEEIEGARGRVVNGTASYMPGIFGLMLAGYVISDIAKKADLHA